MPATESNAAALNVAPPLAELGRKALAVTIKSREPVVQVSVVVDGTYSPRIVLLIEREASWPGSSEGLSVTVDGTTAKVNVLREMTARAVADEVARNLVGQDRTLRCEVRAAISEHVAVDAVVLEICG